jgi:SP family general alpha glucoside:H+ symporter-like MFS transporter
MAWGITRRRLYVGGLCGLCVALFVMGFLGLVPESKGDAGPMATGAMMISESQSWDLRFGLC